MNQCKSILLVALTVIFVQFVVSKKSEAAINLLLPYEGELQLSLDAQKFTSNITEFAGQRWSSAQLKTLTDYREKATELKKTTLKETEHQRDACTKDVPRKVEGAMRLYLESEIPCAKAQNAELKESRKKVKLASKEVKKWRQGLMFMRRKCQNYHPEDYISAVQCLSREVDAERYDTIIARLIVALEETQNELLSKTETAVLQLEQCIEESFIALSTALGKIVADVTKCNESKEDLKIEESDKTVVEPSQRRKRFRLKCLES